MKKFITTLLLSASCIYGVHAQCTGVNFVVSTDTVACGGDSVNIVANGQGAITTALGNDFNIGSVGNGWDVSPAGQFNNPCGPGPNGSTDPHMWMGNTTAAPRELITNQLDVQCGGQVCFDFRMAIQGQASPCEGPDVTATEGIYIECSINNGLTWTTLNYFPPNTSGSFNSLTPGSGDYTGWGNYCFTIPPACETDTTVFRWYQGGSSGTGFDHWGIDNVVISSFDCQAYHYDWTHLPGTPDSNVIDIYTDTDTSFTVIFTDGLSDTCIGTVNLVLDSIISLDIVSTDLTSCQGVDDGAAVIQGVGLPNYSYTISGPASAANTTGIFNNLPTGTYTADVYDSFGCYGVNNFTISDGTTFTMNVSPTDEICLGNDNGTLTISPNGGVNPYNYSIAGSGTGSNGTGAFTSLAPGTYIITIEDSVGCISIDTALIDTGIILDGNFNATGIQCFGDVDGSIIMIPINGQGPYNYSISGPSGNSSNFNGNFTSLLGGSYYAEMVDGRGCIYGDTVTITSPPQVIASCDATPDIGIAPLSVSFINNSTGATDYFWDFGDGNTSNVAAPNHSYNIGTYTAMLVASNGPCSDTCFKQIIAFNESFIEFPNIITPNQDGKNDVFEVKDYQAIVQFHCAIFNRWGKLMYEFDEITGGWDGKTQGGKPVPDGTYFYVVKASGLDNIDYNLKGTINVVND